MKKIGKRAESTFNIAVLTVVIIFATFIVTSSFELQKKVFLSPEEYVPSNPDAFEELKAMIALPVPCNDAKICSDGFCSDGLVCKDVSAQVQSLLDSSTNTFLFIVPQPLCACVPISQPEPPNRFGPTDVPLE